MSNPLYILESLIMKAQEGSLSDEDRFHLNELMKIPENQSAYFELIKINWALKQLDLSDYQQNAVSSIGASFDMSLWKQLADDEKTAPEIEIPPQEYVHELIPIAERKKIKYTISRGSLLTIVTSIAAVLLIILFIRFAPPKGGIEVATLTDSINAKWADEGRAMERGVRITSGNRPLLLREGYAELLFNNQARVTVEGPAEFQILTDDRVYLNYGKVYLTVPREAVGFSVYTQNAKIIDMGTEFGVLAELGGATQLHVLKGKTILMAGSTGNVNIQVNEGGAKRISGDTGEISDVHCRSDYFVRDINSDSKVVWRGQNTLNLADVLGGGNGFGTGTIDMGIHPISGNPSAAVTNDSGPAINEYHPVPSNPYIDGVFIPNGRTQQIVSSRGHIFQECPISSGDWYISFDNVMRQNPTGSDSSSYAPCITQHANMGVTYDLQAIRSLLLPDVSIVRFQSKCGVGTETDRPCNADFWVLVDGKVRYKKTQVKEKNEFFTVDIELSKKDRFLTLVTTDGQDSEGRVFDGLTISTIDSDWCRFGDPVLVLK